MLSLIVHNDMLTLRHYDGYDKPDYIRLMALEEDETNLNAGRFKNYKQGGYDIKTKWHSVRVMISSLKQIEEFINFLSTLKYQWHLDVNHFESYTTSTNFDLKFYFQVYFQNDEDLVAFKLTFS